MLYGHLGSGHLEALHALNTVSAYITERHTEVVEGCRVIHPRQGMNKVSEAKVVKAIDLLSKEWLSMQQIANRVNLSKSSVMTALMPAVRKRARSVPPADGQDGEDEVSCNTNRIGRRR